eukprot:30381-Prymnesium_polylepis.1
MPLHGNERVGPDDARSNTAKNFKHDYIFAQEVYARLARAVERRSYLRRYTQADLEWVNKHAEPSLLRGLGYEMRNDRLVRLLAQAYCSHGPARPGWTLVPAARPDPTGCRRHDRTPHRTHPSRRHSSVVTARHAPAPPRAPRTDSPAPERQQQPSRTRLRPEREDPFHCMAHTLSTCKRAHACALAAEAIASGTHGCALVSTCGRVTVGVSFHRIGHQPLCRSG